MKSTSLERLLNGTTKPFLKPDDMPDAEVPIFINFLRACLRLILSTGVQRQSCFSMNGSDHDAIEWLKVERIEGSYETMHTSIRTQ